MGIDNRLQSFAPVDRVEIYGGQYAVVQYCGSQKIYAMNATGIMLSSATAIIKNESVFSYCVCVANTRLGQTNPDAFFSR
ncbi:MAG TPA: hypothetical protein VIC26_09585 [Marinagarivorans sp.]